MHRWVSGRANRQWCLFVALSLMSGLGWCGQSLAASPSLGSITPRGGQRGSEVVVNFNGRRLADTEEILFYYPGITLVKFEEIKPNRVRARLRIAKDCRLGEHAMRLRTRTGITELRTFYVGALPDVAEKEPNNEFAAPQKIPLNVTVNGVVQNEDVDYFVVSAKKGQRLTAEIEGMRLGMTVFDPYVAILDQKRFELSAADDTPLIYQDAIASIVVPEDGEYVIMVRESAYGGNGACRYRLHVGTFPRPRAALPAGGKFSDEIEVRFLGDVAGEFTRKVKLPKPPLPPAPGGSFGLYPEDDTGIAPSPVPFRLSDVGNVIEREPNNTPDQATKAELPLAFNGVIAEPGDVDFFRFQAKKGQVFDIHCYARRLRSPLDPVMNLYEFKGRGLAGNDDSAGPDSYFRVTFPADKEYVIRVTDHLGQGGPDYVYRIEFTPVRPRLTVSIPQVRRYSQERQTISVPRGNRYATLVSASRANFGGDLVIAAEGLPKGVTIRSENMPANLNVVPVLFEASADAPIGGRLVDLYARHADPKQNIRGRFFQSVELSRGPPGQSIYWRHNVDRAAVAVTEAVPFSIRLVEPKVPLTRNGSMRLKVIAERKDGFDAPITLQMPFRPPGVGAASSVTIPKGKNEAYYPVNASGGAQLRKWKIVIIGQATVGNGPVWVSTQLATLEVAQPFLTFSLDRPAIEQGKEGDLLCKVKVNTPFAGKARVRLLGLPHKVTANDVEITKETKEFTFTIKTDKASPPGQHKSVFCQVIIPQNGEEIVHTAGRTVVRIDPPPPPKKNPPTKKVVAKKPPAKAKAKPKPLTRLQKLRLEQKRRAQAARNKNNK